MIMPIIDMQGHLLNLWLTDSRCLNDYNLLKQSSYRLFVFNIAR